MAGSRGLFDTNILIDYLAGLPAAIDEINRFQRHAISVVTWMEVLVGTSPQQSAEIRLILKRFELVELSPETAEVAIIRAANAGSSCSTR